MISTSTTPKLDSADTASLSGTLADVAAFFRKSERTVKRWMREKDPIEHWKHNGALVFPMEGIVRWGAAYRMMSRGMTRQEAEAVVRQEWIAHMQVRNEWTDLVRRVEQLEQLVKREQKEAA